MRQKINTQESFNHKTDKNYKTRKNNAYYFITSLGFFYPSFAQTTHIVDDDTGINTGVSPFATINATLAAAATNDIISIMDGADNTHIEGSVLVEKTVTI